MTMHDGLVLQAGRFRKEIASRDKSQYKVVHRSQLVIGFPIDEGVLASQNVADEGIVSPAYDIWDINKERVLPEYLEVALRSARAIGYYKAKLKGTTARRRSLRKDDLLALSLSIPSFEVQRHQLNILAAIDTLLDARRRQLKQLSSFVQSRFIEMFGNDPAIERAQLKEICSLITDGTHQPPKFQAKGIPFLFVGNVAGNELTYETSKYISQEDYEALIARTPIGIGDVLVSAVGSFGHPAIVKDKRPFCFQRHIAYFKPMRERVDSIFLHAALLTDESQRYMDKAAKGAAQRTITLKSFKELEIPLPSLALQREFAAFAESVDKSQVAIKREIEKLETLKKALMQEYFG